MSKTSENLYKVYAETHSGHTDSTDEIEQRRTNVRAEANYPSILARLPLDAKVLEIGCNKGYFLMWLKSKGFTNLTGVDLAPSDLEHARVYTGIKELHCVDGIKFLLEGKKKYDFIVFRAVFEHIEKSQSENFLRVVGEHLTPSGVVAVEVPNMDWFFSGHERYMDFTHEIGYTRESLGQILRLLFENVTVSPVKEGYITTAGWFRVTVLKPVVLALLRFIYGVMGEGAGDTLWQYRAILGTASKLRSE